MKLKFHANDNIKVRLAESGVRHGKHVKVHADSYQHFSEAIKRDYAHLNEADQHALAVTCCMTHPNHKDKHVPVWHKVRAILVVVFAILCFLFLASRMAHCQGTSQIDVITFQNSSGTNIKSFAAPFKIKCSTNVTCEVSGSTLTITASGSGGAGGYATIQNAGVAIVQEPVINFLGALACVDNAANTSSDCQISANIAVAHQFVTGVDANGNLTRAAILAADVPTLNQNTSGNAATATALAANPTDCASGRYANAIDASGNLTCAQVDYAQLSGTPQLAVTKTCTGTDKVSAYDSTTGLFTCSTDQTGGGSTPTGTGFVHITGDSQDAAAKTVNLTASTDVAANQGTTTTVFHGNAAGQGSFASVARADLAADAVGWQILCTNTSTSSTITCTESPARKHCKCDLVIGGYSGGGGIARLEMGNASTVDTGTNYAFGGFNIASGTSTAPTVSGIGSGSTAQEGCPVSGSVTTGGRQVFIEVVNPGTARKYAHISQAGVGASAAVTPNLSDVGCTWNNTTDGIGVIQFKACTLINGACSTVNFTATTSITCWGRDDN